MTVATIEGRQVDVDAEGFLSDPQQWDEALAEALSKNIVDSIASGVRN